jgi:hypothetical protein
VNSLPLATIYEVKIPLRKWKISLLQRNPAQMTWHNGTHGPHHAEGLILDTPEHVESENIQVCLFVYTHPEGTRDLLLLTSTSRLHSYSYMNIILEIARFLPAWIRTIKGSHNNHASTIHLPSTWSPSLLTTCQTVCPVEV